MSSTHIVMSRAVMMLAVSLGVWSVTDGLTSMGPLERHSQPNTPSLIAGSAPSPQAPGTEARLRFSRDRGIYLAEGPWPPVATAAARAVRVGGAIRVPTKVKDVRPVYPPEARTARVQGVVIIEALIATDGLVAEARVLRSIPLLDRAAMEAVSQWEFTPTLLNGQPTAVLMTMTVQFSVA
jgi:protein TonB